MKEKYKNMIGFDWQGWPIYKLNLKDILIQLGASIIDGRIGFNENDPILDIFPRRLTDDGMGYSPTIEYITCIDRFNDDDEEVINVWTELQQSQEEIDKFINDCEYTSKILANKKLII